MSADNYANLLIIADDFTGANDTGVQLTKKGAEVNVYFDWKNDLSKAQADIIVVNTDSRALSKEAAKDRIQQTIATSNINHAIYKKIDSTLRGNIGIEIETLLTESNYQIALVIAAFPDMQRTVVDGVCYVNGIELLKTEFASDPKTPIYSSNISQCLAQQTDLPSVEIGLNIIRSHTLLESITCEIKNGKKLFIIDAQTNDDLRLVAKQIVPIKNNALLVGSAGLINYLPTTYKQSPSQLTMKIKNQNKAPMLVISGSMSKITQQQIAHAAQLSELWQVVDINIRDLLPNFTNNQLNKYCQLINQIINQQQNCIIRTCKNDDERFLVEAYCQQYHLTRKELGEYICQCLGQITQNITVENLFLTGGDVAISIAKSLGAEGFHIEGEVSPGVPYGKLIGNTLHHYRIFTKAGGFGEQDIFTRSLEFI